MTTNRKADHQRFAQLDYEDFRRMAVDPQLSAAGRIGFPDEYRAGFEAAILEDIASKLPALGQPGSRIVDLGCGCGDLARIVTEEGERNRLDLWLCDAPEVLDKLARHPSQTHLPGRFPEETEAALAGAAGTFKGILCYSVFHYIFAAGNPYAFLDAVLPLMAPGGRCLLGDIPNASMRRRFLSSDVGRAHHKRYIGRDEAPMLSFNTLEPGSIDDSVLIGLILYCRQAGFHAYLVPQAPALPLANRREDLLIIRP